jgi:hypothetical protein
MNFVGIERINNNSTQSANNVHLVGNFFLCVVKGFQPFPFLDSNQALVEE